jgi:hypothetical protein
MQWQQSLTFRNISTVPALKFKLCHFKFLFAFYNNKENLKINKNKNKQYVNNTPTCTVNTTSLHFRLQSVPPLLHAHLHANGGVGGWGCKYQFAYPPPPLPACPPPLCLPSVPTDAPPAHDVCCAPPLRNRGTLGGARKVCPPPPFPSSPPPLMHIGSERGPPSPLSSPPPAPVYTQRCMGTCCPTPSPPFPPLMCEGRGGRTWPCAAEMRPIPNPPPHPVLPVHGRTGWDGGVGVGHASMCAPLSPRKWGSPRMTGTARAPVHPLLLEHPTPFAPPTLPRGGREGVRVNRGRGRGGARDLEGGCAPPPFCPSHAMAKLGGGGDMPCV